MEARRIKCCGRTEKTVLIEGKVVENINYTIGYVMSKLWVWQLGSIALALVLSGCNTPPPERRALESAQQMEKQGDYKLAEAELSKQIALSLKSSRVDFYYLSEMYEKRAYFRCFYLNSPYQAIDDYDEANRYYKSTTGRYSPLIDYGKVKCKEERLKDYSGAAADRRQMEQHGKELNDSVERAKRLSEEEARLRRQGTIDYWDRNSQSTKATLQRMQEEDRARRAADYRRQNNCSGSSCSN